ncbi:hypothetical protein G7Y89_g10142 [Cudoniella acicularis]|uniref:Uncharacterized protein n=1 Tax=Cudoniella acicularis TaxID=354080 RepID=A0A8H4RDB7_9HELO|nr:hypothetical protein G7Y89_g10142 [Cudoniella acicularis]
MARIIDLADEILEMIFLQHLLREPELDAALEKEICFEAWTKKAMFITKCTTKQCNTIARLILTCKRFHLLLQDFLYSNITIATSPEQLAQFTRTLAESPNADELRAQTDTVTTLCRSAFEVWPLFWFPYVNSLQLIRFNDWSPLEFEDNDHYHTSTVENLYLIDCGASEGALTELFHWPKELKSLHYEVEPGEWSGQVGGEDLREWECVAFVRALSSQKTSLERLVMTRTPLVHEGLSYSKSINLSAFSGLKFLSIFHVFWVGFGWANVEELYSGLPPALEELEVFYDDPGYHDFMSGVDQPWLTTLLEDKRKEYVPKLKRIEVLTSEVPYVDEPYVPEERLPNGLSVKEDELVKAWKVPEVLRKQAERTGIELNIVIAYMSPDFSKI